MQTCPAPDGSCLPASHRSFLGRLLKTLSDCEFRQSRVTPRLPELLAELAALDRAEDALGAWCDELRRWVRWHRGPSYWLTFVFQLHTKALGTPYHFVACDLYAQAQTHFADDIALSSLENAYTGFERNATALGPGFEVARRALVARLRDCHAYYATWSRPFAYRDCNPLADHLYGRASLRVLNEVALEGQAPIASDDIAALTQLIERCGSDDFAYYRIVARRVLGLAHAQAGRHTESAEQFELGLNEALARGLDSEIGHLLRLHGAALRTLGRDREAHDQFAQAYHFECQEPFTNHTTYWQALSLSEVGDTAMRLAGTRVDAGGADAVDCALVFEDLGRLKPALDAYREARRLLGGHLSVQSPFPLARAAKQQMFRSFSANAIRVAAMLQSPPDFLAELERNGPREATELVTEIGAARDQSSEQIAQFRRDRAAYYATLNTAPMRFEDYLAEVVRVDAARRAYLEQSFALDTQTVTAQWCDRIVEQVLALRLPDTIFLLFDLSEQQGTMVLLDMASGTAAPFPLGFGESQLRSLHAGFEAQLAVAGDAAAKNAALEELLARYAELLGPALEPVLRFLPGRHLKIFPRLQLNAVPLHAMRLQGKVLLEHCASISYGQTLGLFLENHRQDETPAPTAPAPGNAALRFVTGSGVPWYGLLLPALRERHGAALQEETQPTWPQLLDSIARRPARDTVFACHGHYDADDVAASHLTLASKQADGTVSFSDLFAQLDLRGSRSVMMGSCESGIVRAEIAAEYSGLPAAMLASGVRCVIGALWKIPQASTAVLVDRYLRALHDDRLGVCAALAQAQREVMVMTREALAAWVGDALQGQPGREKALLEVAAMDALPFRAPYHWAGLHVVGDV